MDIRAEQPEDLAAIRCVNATAFGREAEATLVDRLRGTVQTFSFVAIESGQVVGHIFFSPVTIESKDRAAGATGLRLLGLAPIAVLPDYQRQGIGSALIQHGLAACAEVGCRAVFVLGSPAYYPRFGFVPAREQGLRCEYDVPDEAFMVLELEKDALLSYGGTVKYRSEFSSLE